MKFENIKVGDKICKQDNISYGWNTGKSFWIPISVEKITNTQFTLSDGSRCKKSNGNIIGNEFQSVKNIGENHYHDKKVKTKQPSAISS